mgnify:CR=1 FL=1
MLTRHSQYSRRHRRVRAKVSGTAQVPRLSLRITNRHIIAQLIDDTQGKTLVYATSQTEKLAGNQSERAEALAKVLAAKAKSAKITKCVFDRGGKLYHGVTKRFAETARKAGLEF